MSPPRLWEPNLAIDNRGSKARGQAVLEAWLKSARWFGCTSQARVGQ